MKACPNCGKKFNWWRRAIGEYKEHLKRCHKGKRNFGDAMATGCRGCPAGCFEEASDMTKKT